MFDDERFYQQVADELRTSGPREGLWLKALAHTRGDASEAKIQYVHWRVQQLQEIEREKESLNSAGPMIGDPNERAEVARHAGTNDPKVIDSWIENEVLKNWKRERKEKTGSRIGLVLIIVVALVAISVLIANIGAK